MALDLKLFGEKLKKYRNQLQLSVEFLSEKTGFSESKILMFEAGNAEPTGDEILILADFFKCDYYFFISNEKYTSFEQTEKLYRKYGDDFSSEDRMAVQEFIFLCESEAFALDNLDNINFKKFIFKKSGNSFKQHGIDAAKELRKLFNYSANEIPKDIFSSFRELGIHIFRRKLSNSNISGLCIIHKKAGKCVLVNYDEDIYRQRFTVAHEVGHCILDQGEEVIVSFKNNNDNIEIRANAFASRILIPPEYLKYINADKIGWNEQKIIEYASNLKVNIQPFVYALKDNGYISYHQVKEFEKLKIPKKNKIDPELPDNLSPNILTARKLLLQKGLSTTYVRVCFEAYYKNIISSGRLAEMLLTNENNLIRLLSLYNLKLSYEH